MSRTPLLMLSLLFAPPAGAVWSGGALAILSSDSGHYRQAYEGFQEEWGSSVSYVLAGATLPAHIDAVVAFGSRAGQIVFSADVVEVMCLAPGAENLNRPGTLRVAMLASPAALLARMLRLDPRLKKLRVFWTSETFAKEVDDLVEAAADQGVDVISQRITDPAFLPRDLRTLKDQADALWLMPDPLLVNSVNFAIMKEYASAVKIPFFAPTEGLAEKGATATLAVPFRELGRAAAAALKARLSGGELRPVVYPDKIVVTVNRAAATSTGFDVSKAANVDREISK